MGETLESVKESSIKRLLILGPAIILAAPLSYFCTIYVFMPLLAEFSTFLLAFNFGIFLLVFSGFFVLPEAAYLAEFVENSFPHTLLRVGIVNLISILLFSSLHLLATFLFPDLFYTQQETYTFWIPRLSATSRTQGSYKGL